MKQCHVSYSKNKSFGVCRSGDQISPLPLIEHFNYYSGYYSLNVICLRTLNAYFPLILTATLEPLYEDEKYPEMAAVWEKQNNACSWKNWVSGVHGPKGPQLAYHFLLGNFGQDISASHR